MTGKISSLRKHCSEAAEPESTTVNQNAATAATNMKTGPTKISPTRIAEHRRLEPAISNLSLLYLLTPEPLHVGERLIKLK
jgi:hypothetical protein